MRISWRNLFWKLLTSLISEIDAFSLTGHIDLIIEEDSQGVHIHIHNNGHKYAPFAPSNNKLESTGTGLRIIYQSIQLLNTHNKQKITFQILPGKEEGTTISIFIPYQYSYEWQ